MSKMYPIWNDVQACIYKSSKSYGVRNEGIVNIKVGSSAVWSFDFIKHRTTRRMLTKDIAEFRFYVDGKLLKRSQFNNKTKVYSDNLPINNHQKIMGEQMLEFINGAYKLFIIIVCIVILLMILGQEDKLAKKVMLYELDKASNTVKPYCLTSTQFIDTQTDLLLFADKETALKYNQHLKENKE